MMLLPCTTYTTRKACSKLMPLTHLTTVRQGHVVHAYISGRFLFRG